MPSTVEFPFSDDEALPTIPMTLSYADFFVSANALLDSGSTINLLPYRDRLGFTIVLHNKSL
jgi:hypothetical protein